MGSPLFSRNPGGLSGSRAVRFVALSRLASVLDSLAHVLLSTKVPQNEPSRENGNSPKAEVQVDAADFSKYRDRSQAVAQSLPGGLCPAQQRCISDNLRFIVCEVMDDEVPALEDQPNIFASRAWGVSQEQVV